MNRIFLVVVTTVCFFGNAMALCGQVAVTVSKESIANSGPLCGLYALLGAATSLKTQVDLDVLLDSKFVSTDKGSTIVDLCHAAESINLMAEPMKGMTVSSLKESPHPLVLHLNRSQLQTTSRHWVLYLGDDNGLARIFDAPSKIRRLAYADVLAEWDGVAVQISKPGQAIAPSRRFAIPLGLPLLVCLAIGSIIWIKETTPRKLFDRSTLVMSLGIIFVVAAVANIVHLVSGNGFHSNPSSVALVAKYHYALSLPVVSIEKLCEITGQDEWERRVAIVDARPFWNYQKGHIPGAICVPIDSPPDHLAKAVKHLAGAEMVIVYCENRSCQWDDTIARHMVFAGINDVRLFAGGWQVWKEDRLGER